MIRVLVADDTATTRQLLVKLLTDGGLIEVVGQATNGREAVEMTRKLKPDVVTMDVVMPGVDGVEATALIMRQTPTPIIIVSSVDDIRRSPVSMDALNNGALAILALPGMASPDLSALACHLRETVIAVAKVKSVRLEAIRHKELSPVALYQKKTATTANKSIKDLLAARGPIEIICIACSIGGPSALAKILGDLPPDLDLPILVTQHISRGFTDNLATWLNQATPLTVKVAKDHDHLKANTVYIAPDDCHLGMRSKSQLSVSANSPIKGFRPAATFMFESVAKVFKGASVAVILTGMGDDGLAGLRIQREQGAIIIAQDEASSVVYGMPKAAVNSGLVDLILPLDCIAETLKEIALRNHSHSDGGHH